MKRKVTLPKVRLSNKPCVTGERKARLWHDTLTPPGAPKITRIRIVTPITPRAVRGQIIKAAHDLPEDAKRKFIRNRLTKLDRRLSDEAAGALEDYATAENEFTRAKTARWNAVVVDSSSGHGDGDPRRLWMLRRHACLRKRLARREIEALRIFCAQMQGEPDAPDEARAAAMAGLMSRTADLGEAWMTEIARLGKLLVTLAAADRALG